MTQRLLVCTDLDRTLIPNGREPESPQARELFARLALRAEVEIVYVTGRDVSRVVRALEDYELPLPRKLLADVGSTIYDAESLDRFVPDRSWQEDIGADWRNLDRPALETLFQDLQGLQLQEASRQGPFKLSYYASTELNAEALCDEVRARLSGNGIPASVVYSVDDLRNVGLLDILPARATKLHAVRFIMQELKFRESETVFCGDSGNDLDVLASEIPGVLVANASRDVRARAVALAERNGHADALYVAEGGYLEMNGNYAAGILEGAAHYHPIVSDWLGTVARGGQAD